MYMNQGKNFTKYWELFNYLSKSLFCNILNVNSIERIMAVVIIATIFNLSIWYFAAKYQTIKRTLNKNDKSN